MSLYTSVEHNFNTDLQDQDFNYSAVGVDYIYVNDTNAGSYPNGIITFGSQLMTQQSDINIDYSESYLTIPYEVSVSLSNSGTAAANHGATVGVVGIPDDLVFSATNVDRNSMIIGPKGSHHLIDNTVISYSGITVNQSQPFQNIYFNEQLKEMSSDKYALLSEILSHSFDNADSYTINDLNRTKVAETNNYLGAVSNNPSCASWRSNSNTGHVKRCKQTNYNFGRAANSAVLSSESLFSDGFGQRVGIDSGLNDVQQQGMYLYSNKLIKYRYIAHIPLYVISDFYKNLPSITTSSKFQMRIQTNISSQNTWTVEYENITTAGAAYLGHYLPVKSESNQASGNTCPFLLSNLVKDSTMPGIVISNDHPAGTYVPKITVSTRLLWEGDTTPCRLWLKQVKLLPQLSQMILKDPIKTITYRDYYTQVIKCAATAIDYTTPANNAGNSKGQTYTMLFPTEISCARRLFIIPYASGNNNAPVAYQSLVSSAPNTTSFCRLTKFRVNIGGQSIFSEDQFYNNQFYLHSVLPIMSKLNGSAHKADIWSGQISYSDWQKCYTTYVFDMQRVGSVEADSVIKQFQISFTQSSSLACDFLVLLEYEKMVSIDRTTGEIAKV